MRKDDKPITSFSVRPEQPASAASVVPGDQEVPDNELPFNAYGPNVYISGWKAQQLMELELSGGPVLPRLTAGLDDERGERGRQKAEDRRERFRRLVEYMTAQQWDRHIITVGGIEMTNAEARAARLRILEEPDRFTRWAREQRLIRDGEEQAFLATVRRTHELEEIARNNGGHLSGELEAERERIRDSALGRAADQVTAFSHKLKHRSVEASAERSVSARTTEADGSQVDALRVRLAATRVDPGADAPVFSSTAPLGKAFAAAGNAASKRTVPINSPVDPAIAATGLSL